VAKLDLCPEWLELVQRILAFHLPEVEVLAYGSRVVGTSHDGSDLDLIVRNPSNSHDPIRNLADVRDALMESNLPILVDILDWSQIPDSFRDEIKRTGVVISTSEKKQ
jgi:predicted nucleotidyltransferase